MPKKLDLTDNLEQYIINHSENLSDVQNEIIQHNISLGDQQRLQISISQAQFLQTLIKTSDIKKILETKVFENFIYIVAPAAIFTSLTTLFSVTFFAIL